MQDVMPLQTVHRPFCTAALRSVHHLYLHSSYTMIAICVEGQLGLESISLPYVTWLL